MLRAAVVKATRAFVAPAPFVDFTHAPPRSVQTLDICGMFGIGTPPTDAAPNCLRIALLTVLPAIVLAGKRPFAAARAAWPAGRIMKLPTTAFAERSSPWVEAYFVTMKPWTPRNGTERNLIAGSCMIRMFSLLVRSVSASHGPVIQKAARPLRNESLATP